MAANKFATMLHRNTHKITVILVYAVLEWILIFLLLLNSFFSYLISKFANYFGLKPPCLWCTRVDHIFEPAAKEDNSYTHHFCEAHATEISKLAYCRDHRKLVDWKDMCRDCSSSLPSTTYSGKPFGVSHKMPLFSWVTHSSTENGGSDSRCCCCDSNLTTKFSPPYFLFKPSWNILDYSHKGNLISEEIEGDDLSDSCKNQSEMEQNREADVDDDYDDVEGANEQHIVSDIESFSFQFDEREEGNEDEKADAPKITTPDPNSKDFIHPSIFNHASIQTCCREDESLDIISLHSKARIHHEFDRLIPIDVIDSSTTENQRSLKFRNELQLQGTFDSESGINLNQEIMQISKGVGLLITDKKNAERTMFEEHKSLEKGEIVDSSAPNGEDGNQNLVDRAYRQAATTQAAQNVSSDSNDTVAAAMKELNQPPALEEESSNLLGDDTKSNNLIDVKILDQEPADQSQTQVATTPSVTCLREYPLLISSHSIGVSTSPDALIAENEEGQTHTEKAAIGESINFAENNQGMKLHLSLCSEASEVEEGKFPDTPTYMEGLHHLHKKLLLSEKRESVTEESFDGSVISEMEGGSDTVLSIERLTAALKAERKALRALYEELEEERSASAIAANQTMAMITRLQEEKAAMQMEALQYQRMMEEQSEYDQEALQLLNELMIKREKEKQELEKELEILRKKVLDYEAKEKMIRRRKDASIRSRFSSATCSNAEDSDELSIDLNQEGKEEDNSFCGNQERNSNNGPTEAVLELDEIGLEHVTHLSTLEESLTEFEEERMSILEQLKALEEKLFTLGDDEQFFEDVEPIQQWTEYNEEFNQGYEFSNGGQGQEISDGISEELIGKQYSDRTTRESKAKSLLPLFDAIHMESEERALEVAQVESDSARIINSSVSKFDVENKKLAIEEEVDHVYERLQALEADREFLKHCITSLKKGDKGMDLLQEILQHLRDLRTVELRVRNMGDSPLM